MGTKYAMRKGGRGKHTDTKTNSNPCNRETKQRRIQESRSRPTQRQNRRVQDVEKGYDIQVVQIPSETFMVNISFLRSLRKQVRNLGTSFKCKNIMRTD